MPSGPKKRRAERKKNDTITKTSSNPPTETYEEKVVAAIESQAVDQKTNPETDTFEEGVVAAIESRTVDKKTNEAPMIVDDENIQTNTNSKKTEPIVNAVHLIEDAVNDTFEDSALKHDDDLLNLDSQNFQDASNSSEGQLKSCNDEPPAFGHQNSSSVGKIVDTYSGDQNQEVVKLLEQMVSISNEMGFYAEKQVSLAKDFSLKMSQLLEELKSGKMK